MSAFPGFLALLRRLKAWRQIFHIKLPRGSLVKASEPSLPIQTNDTDVVNGVKTKANNDVDDDPTKRRVHLKPLLERKKRPRREIAQFDDAKVHYAFHGSQRWRLEFEDAAAAMLMSEGGTDAKTAGDFNEIEVKKKIEDYTTLRTSYRVCACYQRFIMDSRNQLLDGCALRIR